MQEIILIKIREILESIGAIKEVYGYALEGNPKKYPAAIFFFQRFDNSFQDTASNFKILNFKLFLVINAAGTDVKTIQETLMPKLMDTVIAKFDEQWNGGTLDGHRIWCLITGGELTVSVEQKGKVATADLTLQVKLSTEN